MYYLTAILFVMSALIHSPCIFQGCSILSLPIDTLIYPPRLLAKHSLSTIICKLGLLQKEVIFVKIYGRHLKLPVEQEFLI